MVTREKMDDIDDLIDSMIGGKKTNEYLNAQHKDTLNIQTTPSKGDGVFASRHFRQEPIATLSKPIMHAIDEEFIPISCYHCLAVTQSPLPPPTGRLGYTPAISLKTCGGCGFARFCNRECQVAAWSYHKLECKIFKKLGLQPALFRAVLRVVLLKAKGLIDDEWGRIMACVAHEQSFSARGRSNLDEMADGIHLITGLRKDWVTRLMYIIKANGIEIPTPIYGGMGVMLDPLVAKANHSCRPNMFLYRPQSSMVSGGAETFAQLLPLRDIEEGEELLLCYIAPTADVKTRKSALIENYFFECVCELCEEDRNAQANLDANDFKQFESAIGGVSKHMSKVSTATGFQNAASALNKMTKFYDSPTLYTTGSYPELAMLMVLEGLKAKRYDEALINLLRIHFMVNPRRFVGRHNPTKIYTESLLLDVLDVLTTVEGEEAQKSRKSLETRGLSKLATDFWRARFMADLQKRIEGSGAIDLLIIVEKRQPASTKGIKDADEQKYERQMSQLLGLKESQWNEAARNAIV